MSFNTHKFFYFAVLFATLAFGTTACSDDDAIVTPETPEQGEGDNTQPEDPEDGENPENPDKPAEPEAEVLSVASLRAAILALNPTEEEQSLTAELQAQSLEGEVISDREGGNQQAFLVTVADATQEAGAGLILAISDENNTFKVGDVIRLSLSDATFRLFNNLLQVASHNVPTLTEQRSPMAPIAIEPEALKDYESQLVVIRNTQPAEGESGTWNSDKNKGNVTMMTLAGKEYKVRVNQGAVFGGEVIPEDKSGEMVGIAGVFRDTYQLAPRTKEDIRLTEARFETPARKATLAEVLAQGEGRFEVEDVVVVGANEQGLMVEQKGARIYVFVGEQHQMNMGTVLNIKGKTTMRNGLLQFGKGTQLEEMAETEVTLPQPQKMTAADFETYRETPEIRFVEYEGTILVSGNYVNVEIKDTSLQGSLDYMSDAFKEQYNGHKVSICGWLFGAYKGFIYTLPTTVKDLGQEEEVVPEGAIYYNTFDKELATKDFGPKGKDWPTIGEDAFDGWNNHKGSGVAEVTYTSEKATVRTNQSSKGELSLYDGSGKNNIFFSTAPNFFAIHNIAVSSPTLRLTFGAQRYAQGASNEFLKSDFEVRVSADGEVWSQPLAYTFEGEDGLGMWRKATLDFTLPQGVDKLHIRFLAKQSSVNRLDDVLLTAGNGGQEVVFGGDETVPTSTIAEVLGAEIDHIYKIEGQIIGTHEKGFLIKDSTGIILTFKKKHGMKTGSKVTVEGATTRHGGMTQFGETSIITVLEEGTYTQPTPEVFTAKEFEEYVLAPSIRYITYEGVMTSYRDEIYQWHNNVAVEGTDIIGAIQYPSYDLNIKQYENLRIRVTGYALGASQGEKGRMIGTMVTAIEVVE